MANFFITTSMLLSEARTNLNGGTAFSLVDNIVVGGGTAGAPATLTVDEDLECNYLLVGRTSSGVSVSYLDNPAHAANTYGKLVVQDGRRIYTDYQFASSVLGEIDFQGLGQTLSWSAPGQLAIPDEIFGLFVETAFGSGVYEPFVYMGESDPYAAAYSKTTVYPCLLDPRPTRKPFHGFTAKDGVGFDYGNYLLDINGQSISRAMFGGNANCYAALRGQYNTSYPYCPNVSPDPGVIEMGMMQRWVNYSNGNTELTEAGDWTVDTAGNIHAQKAPQEFTLAAGIDAVVTALSVNEDISTMPATGWIAVDDELIRYMAKDDATKTFSALVRGEHVTDAASHLASAAVWEGGFVYVVEADNQFWWRSGSAGSYLANFGQTTPSKGEGEWRRQAVVNTDRNVKAPSIRVLGTGQGHALFHGLTTGAWVQFSGTVYANNMQVFLPVWKGDSPTGTHFTQCAFIGRNLYSGGDSFSILNLGTDPLPHLQECLIQGGSSNSSTYSGQLWFEDCVDSTFGGVSYRAGHIRYSGRNKSFGYGLGGYTQYGHVQVDAGSEFWTQYYGALSSAAYRGFTAELSVGAGCKWFGAALMNGMGATLVHDDGTNQPWQEVSLFRGSKGAVMTPYTPADDDAPRTRTYRLPDKLSLHYTCLGYDTSYVTGGLDATITSPRGLYATPGNAPYAATSKGFDASVGMSIWSGKPKSVTWSIPHLWITGSYMRATTSGVDGISFSQTNMSAPNPAWAPNGCFLFDWFDVYIYGAYYPIRSPTGQMWLLDDQHTLHIGKGLTSDWPCYSMDLTDAMVFDTFDQSGLVVAIVAPDYALWQDGATALADWRIRMANLEYRRASPRGYAGQIYPGASRQIIVPCAQAGSVTMSFDGWLSESLTHTAGTEVFARTVIGPGLWDHGAEDITTLADQAYTFDHTWAVTGPGYVVVSLDLGAVRFVDNLSISGTAVEAGGKNLGDPGTLLSRLATITADGGPPPARAGVFVGYTF